ncbi:MAG: hypothetical protein QM221_04735 [Bacillota bacterium]|nr:hypothetical protein [Bacillota bacterium]
MKNFKKEKLYENWAEDWDEMWEEDDLERDPDDPAQHTYEEHLRWRERH